MNTYAYALMNPTNLIDPIGLDATYWDNDPEGRRPWHGARNGNWGGKCWAGGQYSCGNNGMGNNAPTDSADYCYMLHDKCREECNKKYKCDDKKKEDCKILCDRDLVRRLRSLSVDPRQWPNPPAPGTEHDSRKFRGWAIVFFDSSFNRGP